MVFSGLRLSITPARPGRWVIAAVALAATLAGACGGTDEPDLAVEPPATPVSPDEAATASPSPAAPTSPSPKPSPKPVKPPGLDPCSLVTSDEADQALGTSVQPKLVRRQGKFVCDFRTYTGDTVLALAAEKESMAPNAWIRATKAGTQGVKEIEGLGEAALYHAAFTGVGLGTLAVLARPYVVSADITFAGRSDAAIREAAIEVIRAALRRLP